MALQMAADQRYTLFYLAGSMYPYLQLCFYQCTYYMKLNYLLRH